MGGVASMMRAVPATGRASCGRIYVCQHCTAISVHHAIVRAVIH